MSDFWKNLSSLLFALLVAKNMQKQKAKATVASQIGATGLVRSSNSSVSETNYNTQVMNFDKEKLDVEREKIVVERQKVAIERDKLVATSLIEDFKARYQEVILLKSQNIRWQALYMTALTVLTGWTINYSDANKIDGFFIKDETACFVLLLVFINAIYIYSLALRGYEIQQLGLYLYSKIGENISNVVDSKFNDFEYWRKMEFNSPERKGKLERIKSFYYFMISFLPIFVSLSILVVHFKLNFPFYIYSFKNGFIWRNLFFIFVSIFTFISFYFSISTIRMAEKWKQAFAQREKNWNARKKIL